MKTNLYVFVSTTRLFNSFLTNEILEALSFDFNLHVFSAPDVIIPKKIADGLNLRKIQCTQLKSSPLSKKLQILALDFETLCESKRVLSFETRIRHRFNILANENIGFYTLSRKKNLQSIIIAILYLRLFRKIARSILHKLSDLDLNVVAQLEKRVVTTPSVPSKVVMLTGGAFGGLENCVSKFCKRKEITSFLVVDNWDNLSSKSIFWNLPNYVGVWGETMRQDAIEIQKFQSYQVQVIGSSRIFPNTSKFLESGDGSSACVTFFGSGWQFSDELNLVKVAAKIMSENSQGLTLVYRPHPAYLNRGIIEKIKSEITLFQNIKLDSEFQSDYNNLDWYESDSLLHIKRLILDSKFVIGAHSTSLVEALYYGKSVIAFSASDNPIFRNEDAWQGYSHMLQIRGIERVFEARSIDEFKERIKQLVSECESPLGEVKSYNYSDSNLVPHILPTFESTYAERLREFLNLN